MVGDAHHSGLLAVVVAGEEIVLIVPGEDRASQVALPPAGVGTLAIDRPCAEIALGVAGAQLRAGREDDLVIVVRMNRDVGEAQHGVHLGSAVQDAQLRLHVGFAGPQSVADGPPHALAHFQLANPDSLAAVGILFHRVLHGEESAGTVVVGNVPLDAARNPRPDDADEHRFDDVLAINEIVVVGFVHAFEDAAADLRQDADADILVLQVDNLISLVGLLSRKNVVHGIGIDRRLRSLREPSEVEHGVGLRVSGHVSGDDHGGLPDRHPRDAGGGERNGRHQECHAKRQQRG